MTVAESRPLRRDAEANRQRILAAADRLFSLDGLDVSMDHVAEAAGVGTGTLYRRFPSKEDLLDELVVHMLGQLLASGTALLERADGSGLEEFLRVTGHFCAERRGCLTRLWQGTRAGEVQQVRTGIREVLGQLLEQAAAHGVVRPEVEVSDVLALLYAMRGIIETSESNAPVSWERHLDFHLTGFSPVGRP